MILGAGVGWMEAEFAALGVPFRERGRRMDEGIAMMRAVWSEDPVTFAARYVPAVIDNMRMLPKPVKPIPIWIGGSSEPALDARRCGCDGWHGSRSSPGAGGADRRAVARSSGRSRISRSRCATAGTARTTARSARVSHGYRAAGVEHVLVEPAERELDDWLRAVERIARAGEGMLS